MRSNLLTTSLLLLPSISALQIPSIFESFYEPQGLANDTDSESHELIKRDGNCAVNYNSCSTLAANYGGACCIAGSTCTKDKANNIACCPIGAVCTGTLVLGSASPTTTGGAIVIGGTTTGPASTAATPTSSNTATITSAAGVVNNPYFPFPIIATTYVNSAACASAYTACAQNYAACTADLGGGGFAVTVVAPQGGVTVSPTVANLGAASASSICSSLSQAACLNLQTTDCAKFGTGAGGSFVVGSTGVNGAARARQTVGCWGAMGVVAGVGLGVAGQMV